MVLRGESYPILPTQQDEKEVRASDYYIASAFCVAPGMTRINQRATQRQPAILGRGKNC